MTLFTRRAACPARSRRSSPRSPPRSPTTPRGSRRRRTAQEEAAPGPIGIAVALTTGTLLTAGAATTAFPIQSISKLFALDLALAAIGDDVFARVGKEPSGDPFNSIVDLERTKGVPRNPFINAGALAVVDILVEHRPEDGDDPAVARLIGRETGSDSVTFDEDVMASEQEGGDLNRAMMSFMRHHGNLHADPDAVMAAYVRNCAIALDCRGLAKAGAYLAATRRTPDDPEADAVAKRHRTVLGLMITCGHYDGSGISRCGSACPPRAASAAAFSRSCPTGRRSRSGRPISTSTATASSASARSR
ncbi:glutaminase [Sphingomonas aerolata]